MNFLWIILISYCYAAMSITALPTSSPTRLCVKYETKRSENKQEQQIGNLVDNSISSNESQEDSDSDDNDLDNNYIDSNSTDTIISTNVSCTSSQNYCFTAYRILSDGRTQVQSQGCWEHSENCKSSSCVSSDDRHNVFFCCCNSDLCNANFIHLTPKTSPVIVDESRSMNEKIQLRNSAVWISFASTGIMLIIIGIVFFISCREKPKPLPETSLLAPSGPGYSSNLYNVDNLKPIEIIGEGKYGTVWKGQINEQPVAIKIFSASKKQYFINEMDIYTQPFMDSCPALLQYFGCDERLNSEGKLEYLLLLSLAEFGCLQDYLRKNTVSFQVFSRMATSIARGISHLHTRIQKGDMVKMCICHRDINSRNVLVKADLSCCIADFGFGTKVNGSRYEYQGEMILAETKSIYEVGTMRYMAPEILEGAVNLRDCETSLKQIDVYSEGLVLWELAMRCYDFYPPEMSTPPYKAPYEHEIGIHPSFDQMRALVLQHKARPLFPNQWGGGSAAHAVKEICEDCWDPDAEARLTSLCVEERLIEISTMKPRSHYVTMSTSLSTNNNIILSNIHSINSPTTAIPSNQIATRAAVENTCDTYLSSPSNDYSPCYIMQKNREMYGQQIQQFQGRNLCLERNLVQIHQTDQSNDEKSIKKCPLSNGNQLINNTNNDDFYDGEYEVLVEELLTRTLASNSQIQPTSSQSREILQKKNNTEKKSSKWRDIVNSKFQLSKRKNQSLNVENVQQSFTSPIHKQVNVIEENKIKNNVQRPKNLDIAPIIVRTTTTPPPMYDFNEIQSYKTPNNDPSNDPFTIVPSSKIVTSKSATLNSSSISTNSSDDFNDSNQLKRQHSIEVFRDVFASSSKVNLKDIQYRVKTPGDLPPSVRRVRASKTLSLYDDRIMDPNDKFIRDNNSL
ncbi:hypothetical protein PVAND_008483 [Polypedilum vanderplanki]|uniref:receptor protein serine/threonine kinase n=1 Tax=Polypedilum vanderplanki TaxID=319348 RepID=A0A9J6C9W9_POLVA|nr:hypothetical protein PVAND_008483 [Polypedilum vanderplanki]